jgi:hypothetical protein
MLEITDERKEVEDGKEREEREEGEEGEDQGDFKMSSSSSFAFELFSSFVP